MIWAGMSAFGVLAVIPRLLLRHGVWWWATLILTWVLQFGVYSDYQDFRIANGAWVHEIFGVNLPETFSPWWFAIPFGIWVMVSLFYRELIHQMTEPRLLFRNPRVERVPMGGAFIYLGKVDVVNAPHNPTVSGLVGQANCVVTFSNLATKETLTVQYARWTENPKPRLDETQPGMVPKFLPPMNFRDLVANRATNTIDFAVKAPQSSFFCAMTGTNQGSHLWQVIELSMGQGNFEVCLVINGTGLREAARFVVVLKNCGSDDFEFFNAADYYLTDAAAYRYAA